MKRTVIKISLMILVVVVLFICFYFLLTTPKFAGDFSISAYQAEIENENFHTDNTYGKITDYKSAASAGRKAITDRFENSEGGIFEWMGCSVSYDAENDAYYIRTYHVNPNMLGGAYDVIIQADGTVFAIWGEK